MLSRFGFQESQPISSFFVNLFSSALHEGTSLSRFVLISNRPQTICRLLSNITFPLPLFLSLSWIPILIEGVLVPRKAEMYLWDLWPFFTILRLRPKTFFFNSGSSVSQHEELDNIRMAVILLWTLARALIFREQIQAYLRVPKANLRNLEKAEGMISIKDFQKKVAPIFYFLCPSSIQLLAPPLLTALLTLALFSFGEFDRPLLSPGLLLAPGTV